MNAPLSSDRPASLRCGPHTLHLGPVPLVMGVLNVTPDSFYDGGRFDQVRAAVAHARTMAAAGAAIIDIGGESTRPGAREVPVQQEIDRVLPVIAALTGGDDSGPPLSIPLSIDTRKAAVAEAALRAGCSMVNDVSACGDPAMADVLRGAGDSIPVVIMHMQGAPGTMQANPRYDDVTAEVGAFLLERSRDLERSGIDRRRIILDPGIGFGKRLQDNLVLLKNVDALRALGYPVLIGASRKSFIGGVLGAEPRDRLSGSLAVAAHCFEKRVEMVRAHDVRETVDLLRVLDAMSRTEPWETGE